MSRRAVVLVTSVVMAGCKSSGESFPVDAWYATPPPEVIERCRDAPAQAFAEVPAAAEQQAEARLRDRAFVEISVTESDRLLGKRAPGQKPYLVRAVYFQRATGQFDVRLCKGDLIVHHGSLGRHRVPMQRQVLVVSLDAGPRRVFVTCSMAT
jgi:hypothetical protein